MFCESRVGKQRPRHRLFPVSLCDGATPHTATTTSAMPGPRCARRCQLQQNTQSIPNVKPVLWQCGGKTGTPHSSCSSRPVEVQGGNGGKRNDATSLHLIVLWVLRKTRGDMCKMCPYSLHKTPFKVPRTNGCRLKPRVSQRRRADKENKHHRISKHPPWGSNPRPQG